MPSMIDGRSDNAASSLTFLGPANGCLTLQLSGRWKIDADIPALDSIEQQLTARPGIREVAFDSHGISAWDTGLLVFLKKTIELLKSHNIQVNTDGLPQGVHRLIELANAVPPKKDTGRHGELPPLVERIGQSALNAWQAMPEMVRFLGESTLALGRFFTGRAQYRRSDLLLIIQEVGPQALPIVSLISFLVGLIVAYMGAVQLSQFGAQIFIANLVGLGMLREMGALMTGIIMAGRTGAAFAAQLGTMQVNEEIDAFKTLGINPIDFLVLPRMLALIAMMPLLVLYSGLVGVLAGMLVAVTAFDIGVFEYYQQTLRALEVRHILVGITKGTIYGMLIAYAGCLRGIQCGRSAQAVGQATTSAVVTSIVFIVVAASLMTIMYQRLGI